MSRNVTVPEFLKHFRCVGAECADTCCVGWDMQITDNDYKKYQEEAPELLDFVGGTPGKYTMKRDPKTDYCVKFTGGLCGIQQTYGEEFLGEACRLYPRVTRGVGNRVVMSAALSCPEIARLALFDDAGFALSSLEVKGIPDNLKDYLPAQLAPDQAVSVHYAFIKEALRENTSAERALMRAFIVAESLERIDAKFWPDAVPFYFSHADAGLPVPESKNTDPFFLLQALCGLVVAAKKLHQRRLINTLSEMERALHISVRLDTLAIVPLPDSYHAAQAVEENWRKHHQAGYAPILKRYLAMQFLLALFPFYGFGKSLTERVAVIGIRLATVKLALMSACALSVKPLEQTEIIRIIQSISRLLDHIAEVDFSLKIYGETGWLKKNRLRALLGDN